MKALVLAATLIGNTAIAASQTVRIPLNNFSCKPGPFATDKLRVVLPNPIGSLGQKGVLSNVLLDGGTCQEIVANLSRGAHEGVVDLLAKLNTLTTIRVHDGETRSCESAREETVSIQLTPDVEVTEGANTNGFHLSSCP